MRRGTAPTTLTTCLALAPCPQAILDPAKFGEVSPYYYASRVLGVMKVIVFNK